MAPDRNHLHSMGDICKFALTRANHLSKPHILQSLALYIQNTSDKTYTPPAYALKFFDKLKLKTILTFSY